MEIDSSESTRSVVLELYNEVIIVVFVSGVDGGAGLEKVGEQWIYQLNNRKDLQYQQRSYW